MGGIVQSIGQALLEHAVYDENGQLLSGSLMDYVLPRADEVPMLELGFTKTTTPTNPLGVKGVGEMGTIVALPTIANAVMESVDAEGVGVVIEARHLCMMMRGVEKQNSVMTTSSVLGSFHHDQATRLEFLHLLNRNKP